MHKLSYCFLVCLLTFVPALAKDGLPSYASSCGPATIDFVKLSVCDDNVEQCQLRTDSKMLVTIDFTPQIESQNLTRYIAYEQFDGWLQFEGDNSCSGTGLSCPLPAGTQAHYVETADLAKMPKGGYSVEWSMLNENRDELVCVSFALIFV